MIGKRVIGFRNKGKIVPLYTKNGKISSLRVISVQKVKKQLNGKSFVFVDG